MRKKEKARVDSSHIQHQGSALVLCVWNILDPLTPMMWHVHIYHALMIKHPIVILTLSLVSYYCMFSHCSVVDLLYQAVTT